MRLDDATGIRQCEPVAAAPLVERYERTIVEARNLVNPRRFGERNPNGVIMRGRRLDPDEQTVAQHDLASDRVQERDERGAQTHGVAVNMDVFLDADVDGERPVSQIREGRDGIGKDGLQNQVAAVVGRGA